jgi:peptide/nickel transport system substrate-binding protein
MSCSKHMRVGALLAVTTMLVVSVTTAFAAAAPKRGGTLITAVDGEPNTTDCHSGPSSLVLQYIAPHYSTLLRFDTENWPKVVGDLAADWTVAADGLTYTVELRSEIFFHDGSPLTSQDVKASYERLRNPPEGVVSLRKATFADIAGIETPDARTVVFRLSQPNAAFPTVLASPFNCIYSAKKLAENPKYPSTEVMGSGPFTFVEYVKGQSWSGKRFENYFIKNQPYLDGFKAIIMSSVAFVNAMMAGQVDANFRLVSPPERDRIKNARGDKVAVQSILLNNLTLVGINTEHKPLDDVRVRAALNLAVDRKQGDDALSKITILKDYGGLLRPGSEFAESAEERARLPGVGGDIRANREKAKQLLTEAGVPDLKLKLLNRSSQNPYQPLAIFLMDQWRQIGVTTEMTALDYGPYFTNLASGNFDVAIDFNSAVSDDPTEVLSKFLPGNPINYTRDTDQTLSDLYAKQKAMLDVGQRKALVKQFEERVFARVPAIPLFWNDRVVVTSAEVKGWTIPPSMFVGHDLAGVWLDR